MQIGYDEKKDRFFITNMTPFEMSALTLLVNMGGLPSGYWVNCKKSLPEINEALLLKIGLDIIDSSEKAQDIRQKIQGS